MQTAIFQTATSPQPVDKVQFPSIHFTMILPVYNEEARVRRVVDYYRQFAKLIAVDNYSTDQTVSILQNMGVEVVSHRNEGSHQSPEDYRFLISLSSTPYVLLLSCTEFIPVSLMERFHEIAREGFYEVVSSPRGDIYTSGRLIPLWGGRFGIHLKVERFVKKDGVDFDRVRIHGPTLPRHKDRLLVLPRNPRLAIVSLRDADAHHLLNKSIGYAQVEAKQMQQAGTRLSLFGLFKRFAKEVVRFLQLPPWLWNGIALREIWARCVMHTTIYWLGWEAKTGENLERSRSGSQAVWEKLVREQPQ